MNDPLEQQSVIDFVLESETNIDTAARLAKVFPIVQRQIILPVLDDLEKKLRDALGLEWEIYNCREEILVKSYPGFTVSRKSWGEIYVNFENQTHEGSTAIGIWRAKSPKTAGMDSALVEAFANASLSGAANRWWAWYQDLPPEQGNWNAATALGRMHFYKSETVDYFAKEILRVHKIATPILDKFISKT